MAALNAFRSGHLWAALVVALGASGGVLAHEDDPKALDTTPPYLGPGFKIGVDKGAPAVGFVADGVELRSWIPQSEMNIGSANDCWSYTSGSGREYAIACGTEGTAFVEVTDPDNATLVAEHPGLPSTWRDAKVWGTYAYVVTEASGGGIQVFDLSQIDGGFVTLVNTVTTGGGSGKSHNVALCVESGYLYRCGGAGHGLRIFDLNANPANPPFVAEWNTRYSHDAQIVVMQSGPWAGREIAFSCGGLNSGWVETGLDVLDVTDKQNIEWLASYQYPNGVYSHQGWLSEDQQFFYLGDELDEDGFLPTTTFAIDVSDLENPINIEAFTNGNSAVGHNLYTRGNLIFEANYTSGLRVFDTSDDPANPVEVAYFDTAPDNDDASYAGLWSNCPFYASGTIIGTDRQMGLFVWRLDTEPSDLDSDGDTDFNDLLILLAAWGPCPAPPAGCPADLGGNSVVDFQDLLALLAGWAP